MYWFFPVAPRRRFTNRERLEAFAFELPRASRLPGVSAAFRVKDEAEKIEYAIRSVLPVFDEIVVVDNGSEDDTADIVRRLQRDTPRGSRIKLRSYPYPIARYGPEHAETPGDSVHSWPYLCNWTLSHCTHRYVCKWDGDMVLAASAREAFHCLLHEIQRGRPTCWTLAGQTVYRDGAGSFLLARGEVNRQVMLFPLSYLCIFKKRPDWEALSRPPWLRKSHFAPDCFYELKFVSEDEFAHWSTTEFPGPRKAREWENFHLVRGGQVAPERFEALPATFLEDQLSRSAQRRRPTTPPEPPSDA